MEIFSYQIELIRKMGFGNWIKTYPVNPFTIVLIVMIIGFIVLAVNAKTKKKNAERMKAEGAALLILKKQNSFNNNFAEQIRVMDINGERAEWFFYKTRPALYLKPSKNELIVYAEWAQSIRKIIKTAPRKIVINVDYDSIYTIYYKIETDEYLLYKGDEYEDKKWEQKLSSYNIVN